MLVSAHDNVMMPIDEYPTSLGTDHLDFVTRA